LRKKIATFLRTWKIRGIDDREISRLFLLYREFVDLAGMVRDLLPPISKGRAIE
jgi:hypothetical protein